MITTNTTLLELRTALKDRLSSAKVKSFFPDTFLNQVLNDAGRRVANYGKWPALNHALKTQSEANLEYYSYPKAFKPGSIFRVLLDDVEYDMLEWNFFQEQKELATEATVAAVLGNKYFLYPAPSLDDQEITVYGQLAWANLMGDTDGAITSPDLDESIVRLALAACLRKERRLSEANSETAEVLGNGGIIQIAYNAATDTKPAGYMGRASSSRWD